jgi:hypothetical protein
MRLVAEHLGRSSFAPLRPPGRDELLTFIESQRRNGYARAPRNFDGKAVGYRPLVDALLQAPLLGLPASDFIFPMVRHGAEAAGRLLADVSCAPDVAARALSRVAAWSMLQETDEYTPYGWTHTLTIPQAVMSLGLDPQLAVPWPLLKSSDSGRRWVLVRSTPLRPYPSWRTAP